MTRDTLDKLCNSAEFGDRLFETASNYNQHLLSRSKFIDKFKELLPGAEDVLIIESFNMLLIYFKHEALKVRLKIKYFNVKNGIAEYYQLFYKVF